MRSRTIPPDAEVIRSFDELREFRESFFNAEFYFLLLVGRHGLSKSWEFEERCKPRKDRDGTEFSVAHYAKGNITPVEAYRLAYQNQNKLLVFDDGERLWADSTGRYLLRDLTECRPWKCANWRADNRDLERQGIPKSFLTSSRVCLIMNRFAFGDAAEYDAIVDRAQFIYFDPTPLEIHRNTALWFWDQEVFDFIGEHLPIIDSDKLSSRTYVKAYERKPKGDWKEFIARRSFTQSGEQWVNALESDPRFKSVDERVEEFIRRTNLGRSTYFNLKKSLKATAQLGPHDVPKFTLTGRPPDVPDLEIEAKAAAEQERHRAEQERTKQQEEQDYRDLEDILAIKPTGRFSLNRSTISLTSISALLDSAILDFDYTHFPILRARVEWQGKMHAERAAPRCLKSQPQSRIYHAVRPPPAPTLVIWRLTQSPHPRQICV